MKVTYKLNLEVYRTTRESNYLGGKTTLEKEFNTQEDAERWFKNFSEDVDVYDEDVAQWIEQNNFPQILYINNVDVEEHKITTLLSKTLK